MARQFKYYKNQNEILCKSVEEIKNQMQEQDFKKMQDELLDRINQQMSDARRLIGGKAPKTSNNAFES